MDLNLGCKENIFNFNPSNEWPWILYNIKAESESLACLPIKKTGKYSWLSQ